MHLVAWTSEVHAFAPKGQAVIKDNVVASSKKLELYGWDCQDLPRQSPVNRSRNHPSRQTEQWASSDVAFVGSAHPAEQLQEFAEVQVP